MSANDDLECLISDYCTTDAPVQAPDWVLRSALATIDTTRQRRALARGRWRFPIMNTQARAAVAAVAVIAVGAVGFANLGLGPTTSGEPLDWTPARLAQDWPGPVRSEPGAAPVVQAMRHGENTHWAEGGWEGLESPDPIGDVPRDLPWLDIVEVGLSPQGTPSFRLTVAGDGPRPIPEPATRWIAYGLVLDIDADSAADVRIGIDNLPTGEHRAWRTELATGVTLSKAGPPYGAVGGDKSGSGGTRVGLDTWFPGEPDAGRDARFSYSLQEGEREFRFYAWASLIEEGRIVTTDYAPDAGWLEEGDQPGLPLVGTAWIVGADLPDGVTTIEATVEFTADGRVVVDACRIGTGTVTAEGGTLRFSDMSLTESTCTLPGTAEFDAAIWAVLSKPELTYTIEKDVLELHAGQDVLRLQGQYPLSR